MLNEAMIDEIDDLNPPVAPTRSLSTVQMELFAVVNEIRALENRLSFLRESEEELRKEYDSKRVHITQRSHRNINNERGYKANFVSDELGLSDIIDI